MRQRWKMSIYGSESVNENEAMWRANIGIAQTWISHKDRRNLEKLVWIAPGTAKVAGSRIFEKAVGCVDAYKHAKSKFKCRSRKKQFSVGRERLLNVCQQNLNIVYA